MYLNKIKFPRRIFSNNGFRKTNFCGRPSQLNARRRAESIVNYLLIYKAFSQCNEKLLGSPLSCAKLLLYLHFILKPDFHEIKSS